MDTEAPPSTPPTKVRIATVLAWTALVLLAASAILFTLPVSNPGVQKCGSPGWFLLRATSNAPLFTTEGKPIHGWTEAQLRHADTHRCSTQVANRAVPAGLLLAAFWLVALAALILYLIGRRQLRRRPPPSSAD